jgi:hypothetical protein
MDTWGISGSLLLVLYLAQFGVILLVVTLTRRRVLAVPDGQPAAPLRVDAYEAAYLNGGSSPVAAPPSPTCSGAGTWTTRPAAGGRSGWAPGPPPRPRPTRSSGPPTR